MSRRKWIGLALAAAGLIVLFISAAADVIGISSGGSAEMFGRRQIIGTALGALALVAGLVVAFLPVRSQQPSARKKRSRPSQPIKHHKH